MNPAIFLPLHISGCRDLRQAYQLITSDALVLIDLDSFREIMCLRRNNVLSRFIHIVDGQWPGAGGNIIDRNLLILLRQFFPGSGQGRYHSPSLKLREVYHACPSKVLRCLGKCAVWTARPHFFFKGRFRPLAKLLAAALGVHTREDISIPDGTRRFPAGIHVLITGDRCLGTPTNSVVLIQIPAYERIGQIVMFVGIRSLVEYVLIVVEFFKALAVFQYAELGHHERIFRFRAVTQCIRTYVVVRYRIDGRRPLGVNHQIGCRHGICPPANRNLEAFIQIPTCKHIV